MERRKFIKYTSLAGIGVGLFPAAAIGKVGMSNTAQVVQFSAASAQIRHGALNIPFSNFLKSKLPFNWLLDVQQNIFFKDGFQRNEAEDMHITSIALQDGEGIEALQISIQQEQVGLLWKEQYLLLEEFEPLQELELIDQTYDFHLASLEKGKEITINLHEDKSHFVQVLEGEVQNQDAVLSSNTGLGLMSCTKDTLTFIANGQSRVLIISSL